MSEVFYYLYWYACDEFGRIFRYPGNGHLVKSHNRSQAICGKRLTDGTIRGFHNPGTRLCEECKQIRDKGRVVVPKKEEWQEKLAAWNEATR